MNILRGDIFFVELGPTRGKEIDAKRRPVLVISINFINQKSLVVTVIPGSTWKGKKSSRKNEVPVEPFEANGLTQTTVFQCHQMRALDHSRFDRPHVGVISEEDFLKIEEAVKFCLGFV